MQSSGKKKQRKLYQPPGKEDQSANYRKLIIVIALSLVFISAETVGGIISHSISVISDAIHLLTDLIGFIMSFVFIWFSGKKPNKTMTFAYHRTQLFGALGNLFIIWALALFMLFESVNRIINKVYVQEPLVMLIVAAGGLPVNILMYFVLHSGGHSHGLMSEQCGQEHPNALQCDQDLCEDVDCLINQQFEDHCHKQSDNGEQIHKHNKKVTIDEQKNIIRPSYISDSSRKEIIEEQQLKEIVDINKKLKPQSSSHKHHDHQKKDHKRDHNDNKHDKHGHDHHKHDHNHDEHDEHKHDHNDHHKHNHKDHHGHDHSDHHGHDHHEHDHDGHDHHGHSHENMSMKAAVLHALSDIIQSIGLIIASLVIFFFGSDMGGQVAEWNNWHYFDPGATILFTLLVFISTWPITKNCYYIIMEATPPNFSLDQLQQDFYKIEGVTDVHDLHIWDLRPGKTILTAHVFSKQGTQRSVLKRLTDYCRRQRIYHSTFQIEEQQWKDHEDYILCHHDIH